MRAFIEKFNLIRIESNEQIHKVSMIGYKGVLTRLNKKVSYFKLDSDLDLSRDYLIFVNDYKINLEVGLVTQTDEFNDKFQYDGPLGAIYDKNYTDFYVWSPVAKELKLVLDKKEYNMTNVKDVWHVKVEGDFHLKPYYFLVRTSTYFEKVLDPYAKAGTNELSYVIDLNKIDKVIASPVKLKDKTKAIIYEGHVRDMTISLDVESKGLYDGLTEKSKLLNGSVIDYVHNLGITHLQLLPVYDFLGVDDFNKDKYYNWGYNPHQYFLLEGWYSKDPSNPILRINEFVKVVNAARKIGLAINLDVVYNHVYDWANFSLNKLVPNYLYQFGSKGELTNSSGCQNDVASNRYMARRLIVDSLIHLTKTFNIDGYRFDLMGLMDIKTMHVIEEELRKINPYIMLYGEGWNIPNTMKENNRANMSNQKQFKSYAHFNDQFRNLMKGTHDAGYAMGGGYDFEILKQSLLGSLNIFDYPTQSINYVECHDNYTFYDEITIKTKYPEYKKWHYQDFATHLVLIAQGIPFIHAGQEFYRTKQLVENSYQSSDEINQISWNPKLQAVQKLKELIHIRKTHPVYTNSSAIAKTIESHNGYVVYTLSNKNEKIVHYLQNDYYTRKIELGEGEVIFSSQDYSLDKNTIKTSKPGVYAILYKN